MSQQAEQVQTVPEESRAQGDIGFKLYFKYLRAGASVLALLVVSLINILAQVSRTHHSVCHESPL